MAKKALSHDLIVGVIFYAFIGFCYYITTTMLPDSAAFPQMTLALLAILNTAMVINSFVKKPANKFTAKDTAMPLLYFAGIIVYAIVFNFLGYFPATAIMLIAYMLILQVRPIWKIFAITAGYLVFIYVLFVLWLNTNLI